MSRAKPDFVAITLPDWELARLERGAYQPENRPEDGTAGPPRHHGRRLQI